MRTLTTGTTGSDVRAWQGFLVAKGFSPGQIDSFFGPQTRNATIGFQTKQGLSADGVVGPNTFARAKELGFLPPRLIFTLPRNNTSFSFGEAVEFSGLVADELVRIELTTDGDFTFPMVTLINGKWDIANRFRISGRRSITARGFDAANNEIAKDTTTIFIMAPDLRGLVGIPKNINEGLRMVSQRTMLEIFGEPCTISEECLPITNSKITGLLVTRNVGPFVVEGLLPAVEALGRIFASVKQHEPELFNQLGTAGMLCCRRIRSLPGQPANKNFSNHSWGTAIDIKIKGSLDPRGDGLTQLGLLLLHPFFKAERFFWGAGFGGASEDSMHFEASEELIRDWQAQGRLGG